MPLLRSIYAIAFLGLLGLTLPRTVNAQQIEVTDAWARATVPGQTVGAVYMQLRSAKAARVVGVKTPAARRAEIHTSSHEGGVMRMRKLPALELPAGQSVALEPGGNHLMLFDLRRPLKTGERVKLTLVIERAGKRVDQLVEAEVREESGGQHEHH
jgi:copper(I)-binding protein